MLSVDRLISVQVSQRRWWHTHGTGCDRRLPSPVHRGSGWLGRLPRKQLQSNRIIFIRSNAVTQIETIARRFTEELAGTENKIYLQFSISFQVLINSLFKSNFITKDLKDTFCIFNQSKNEQKKPRINKVYNNTVLNHILHICHQSINPRAARR